MANTSHANQPDIYLEVNLNKALGVNNQAVIEKNLVNMVAARLGDAYPYWSFVPRDDVTDSGPSYRLPYVDLNFKYDKNRVNLLFVVKFHVRPDLVFPTNATDREYWQVVVLEANALAATGVPQGEAPWRTTMDAAISKLKEKANGRIRAEIQNFVPLGTADVKQDGHTIVADLEASDLEVRNIYDSDFRVCCRSSGPQKPRLFVGRTLKVESAGSIIRIGTTYERTCESTCSERCKRVDDEASESLVDSQTCFFWLDNENRWSDWLN